MPELAELAIMVDFMNKVSKWVTFTELKKSEISKVKTDLNEMKFVEFQVTAESKGKEMMLSFWDLQAKKHSHNLLVTMGMSGNWTAAFGEAELPKHSHLIMIGERSDGVKVKLALVDTRRFAKWSWKEDFSSNRGPDPIRDFDKFKENFHNRIAAFPKCLDCEPMLDVIMNQSIFNGIGNYLRAEIFDRANVNPFKSFDDLEDEEIEEVLKQCKICPSEAYVLGGGQLRDWKNSFGATATSFKEWMKVYGIGAKILDKGKRTFWFDPKWKNSNEYKTYIKNVKQSY